MVILKIFFKTEREGIFLKVIMSWLKSNNILSKEKLKEL